MPDTALDTKYREVRWVSIQAGAGTKNERSNSKKKKLPALKQRTALLSDVLRNSVGAENPSTVPESLHKKSFKDLAQSPMTEDTIINVLEKKRHV